jgi:hypothetical protein
LEICSFDTRKNVVVHACDGLVWRDGS